MALADVGTGTTLAFSGDSSSFAAFITNVSIDGITRESIETTHLNSPSANSNNARTFIPGDMYDPGEITFDGFFDSSDFAADPLWDQAAGTVTVSFPTGSWACSGFCTSFSMGDPIEDAMTFSATFKFTGPVTIV